MRKLFLFCSVFCFLSVCGAAAPKAKSKSIGQKASELYKQHNYKEAYDLYKVLLVQKASARLHKFYLGHGIECLRKLNRTKEFDEFVELAVSTHSKSSEVLNRASSAYYHIDKQGVIVAGKFERGRHRGRGRYANVQERDRVRSLQLAQKAYRIAVAEKNRYEIDDALNNLIHSLVQNRRNTQSWRLQYLTDMRFLPDHEDGYYRNWRYNQAKGAPVDENGDPVLYQVPTSYEGARSDGERWIYCTWGRV